jgi:hypothetical protein
MTIGRAIDLATAPHEKAQCLHLSGKKRPTRQLSATIQSSEARFGPTEIEDG